MSEVRVRDARRREEFVSVREEEVDTGPLLTHLDEDTVHRAEEHAVLGLEAVEVPGALGELVLLDALDDLIHLARDLGLVGLVPTELGEVDLGLLDVAALDIEPGRLGRERGSEEDESGKDELNRDRESPREGVIAVVERVVDGVREEARREKIGNQYKASIANVALTGTHIPTVAMSW